jgi:phosphoglycerate kinase
MQKELDNLQKVVNAPNRPLVAILGGSKVSDKLAIIENLLKIADKILICGGMANTFLVAKGQQLGKSLVETNLLDTAKKIIASDKKNKIVLPVDFNCNSEFKDDKPTYLKLGQDFNALMALDIGPNTIDEFSKELVIAKTVF